MNGVGRARAIVIGEALRNLFHFADGIRIKQFAQVGFAQQFTQLVLIDGEGLSAAFGQRRVAIVEKVGHITEQERSRKRRWLLRLHHMHAQLPLLNRAKSLNQCRHIENIAQTLAIGLKQQWE